ncbi:unnamed protein product [Amaranthus hypochondriacus]
MNHETHEATHIEPSLPSQSQDKSGHQYEQKESAAPLSQGESGQPLEPTYCVHGLSKKGPRVSLYMIGTLCVGHKPQCKGITQFSEIQFFTLYFTCLSCVVHLSLIARIAVNTLGCSCESQGTSISQLVDNLESGIEALSVMSKAII